MKLERLPVIRQVVDSGAEDRVFDGLVLAGPLVICLVAALGRSPVARGVAAGYVLVFVAHVLRNAAR